MNVFFTIRKRLVELFKESLFIIFYKKKVKTLNVEDLDGQSIAIIGSANSAFKNKLGDFIDNHDLVIRINKGVELIKSHKDFIGSRTDLLFHSLYDKKHDEINSSPITLDLWSQNYVEKLVCVYNVRDKRFRSYFLDYFIKNKSASNVYQIDSVQKIDPFKLMYPFIPTTGFCAIITVLNSNFKKLYITGFTFFQTPSVTEYRVHTSQELGKVSTTYHNFDLEFVLFCEIYKKFENLIIVDETLDRLIGDYFNINEL